MTDGKDNGASNLASWEREKRGPRERSDVYPRGKCVPNASPVWKQHHYNHQCECRGKVLYEVNVPQSHIPPTSPSASCTVCILRRWWVGLSFFRGAVLLQILPHLSLPPAPVLSFLLFFPLYP